MFCCGWNGNAFVEFAKSVFMGLQRHNCVSAENLGHTSFRGHAGTPILDTNKNVRSIFQTKWNALTNNTKTNAGTFK